MGGAARPLPAGESQPGPQAAVGTAAAMTVGAQIARGEVVSLDLEFGSYELGVGECRELIRLLGRRAGRPGAGGALACARSLEALVDEGRGSGALSERQLDAMADAAWDWLQRDGSAALPERVLRLLDVLRARHGHE